MEIRVESNFGLLHGNSPETLDLECSEIRLQDLLVLLSRRSSYAPTFLRPDGTGLSGGWEIEVNGRALASCEEGLETVVKDGDTIHIALQLMAGG